MPENDWSIAKGEADWRSGHYCQFTTARCPFAQHEILAAIGISPLYLQLFHIDLVAVSIQLLLLAIQNVLFYLDARGINVTLCALFFFGNILFTLITIEMGAWFYGYGFATATLLAALTGLWLLSRKFDRLEYETFMLQGR